MTITLPVAGVTVNAPALILWTHNRVSSRNVWGWRGFLITPMLRIVFGIPQRRSWKRTSSNLGYIGILCLSAFETW